MTGAPTPETTRRRLRIPRRRPRVPRWRLVSPTGAKVVSLRQLSPKQQLRVTAPSMFTTTNMCAGFASVLLAFRGEFTWAAALIAVGILFDIADGAVARLVGATSPFGVQLDSMADLITFGVAPAVLIHTWALEDWPFLAWTLGFFWLACAAFRLARFNVTVDPLADKRYFIGLPSPGAAAVPMATIFAVEDLRLGPDILAPLVISVVPAVLMVTGIRFRSFRSVLALRHGPKWQLIVVVVALTAGLWVSPSHTLLCFAYGYVLTAPLGWLTRPLRARYLGPESVAPQRTHLPSVFLMTEPEGVPPAEKPPA